MPAQPSPSPYSPYVGRGAAVRFAGTTELGAPPKALPTPPAWGATVPRPSRSEGALPFLTVAQAASLIKRRRLSPVELTQALLARIQRLNPLLNAYITVTADLALRQARDAESAIMRGDYLGPLHGIPVSLKDLIGTAGVLTTGGTGALSDWVPTEDAVVWQRLRKVGAVLLGKVGLHEMAAGFSSINPFFGPTHNPWDPQRVTGGSSGGSGASVAGHLALASIGSDTAGSIRVPSSLCGIVGLKPTFGRVSTRGALYLSWSLDHLGPMTKTVEDAALLLNVIAGYDPLNALSAPAPTDRYTADLRKGVRGLRLAVPANYFWEFEVPSLPSPDAHPGEPNAASPERSEGFVEGRQGLDPVVAGAVRDAIQVLRDLGATVSEVEIEGLEELQASTINIERAFFVEEIPLERRERFSETYRNSIQRGLESPAAEYLRHLQRIQRTQELLEKALEGYDAYVLPTTPLTAPTIAAVEEATAAAAARAAAASAAGAPPPTGGGGTGPLANVGRYTSPFNRSGQPALSIPCGFSHGLPIGLMIVGHRFNERTVLRIGHAYQQATDWHKRRPAL